jgi:hypothetical protein
MSDIFLQFKNLIEFANNFQNNKNIYFFIKNYAFMRAFRILSQNPNCVDNNENANFTQMMNDYKQEKTLARHDYVMPKDEYKNFLENLFDTIDFENANSFVISICKDLIEIQGIFGELEDLSERRSIIIF